MHPDLIIAQLNRVEEFLNRSTQRLTEEHAGFSPTKETYTVAAQFGHIAQTVEWFVQGAFDPKGFDMDFENHDKAAQSVKTLSEGREWVARAFESARTTLASKSPEELAAPIAEGPVMGGAPRFTIVAGIEEHTAHHRGALSVYTRLTGQAPPMPYMD